MPETSSSTSCVHIKHTGIYDSDSTAIPGRFLKAAALRQLQPEQRPSVLAIPRAPVLQSEFNNLDLFPGMFPTLWPYGSGGFEDPQRATPIEFRNHVEHLLDLNSRTFARHRSFIFVALNIIQRRLALLHTSLAVKKARFAHVAEYPGGRADKPVEEANL